MDDLINAYNSTSYNVFNPSISLRIDQLNPELDDLLVKFGEINWAYVTAYNPFSELLTDEENKERHKQLKERIEKYPFFEGEGVGTDPSWKPEQSFLILGISEANARELGKNFQQNAIVIGKHYKKAKLVLLK